MSRRTSRKAKRLRDARGRFVRVPQKDKPPELWPWRYEPEEYFTPRIKMWVYVKRNVEALQRAEYDVGYFKPDALWHVVKTFPTEAQAQELVHFLNGGNR